MTKQAKKVRSAVCGLVSFILAVSLTLLLIIAGLRTTALNPSYAIFVSQKSDYAELMQSELKEKFVSYGNACNVDESFFDSAFQNIFTVEQIDSDTKTVIRDFYSNEIKSSIDTSGIEAELLEALKQYATQKGFVINDNVTENLEVMTKEMGQLYNAYVSLFSSSYFEAAAGMLNRYLPAVKYAAMALSLFCVIAIVLIRLSFKKAKNYLRFFIYSGTGSSLMLLTAPAVMLIMKIGSKINLANASLYGFASRFINYIFVVLIALAVLMMIITGIIALIRNKAQKLN